MRSPFDEPGFARTLIALLDQRDFSGFTAILNTTNGHEAIQAYRDRLGNGVLHLLGERGWDEGLRVVLAADIGNDAIHRRNEHGHTPLSLVSLHGHVGMMQRLIEHGGDLHGGRVEPLFCVKHPDGVGCLIDAGVDLERCNEEGDTALFVAASARRNSVVQALLDAGAHVRALSQASLLDSGGQTVLDRAFNVPKNVSVLRTLLHHDPDLLYVPNRDGTTVVDRLERFRQHPNLVTRDEYASNVHTIETYTLHALAYREHQAASAEDLRDTTMDEPGPRRARL